MSQTETKTVPNVAIGIDLGTTYSCVGVFQNGKVEIIPNDQGNRTTPSYVAFTETEKLVGDAAKVRCAQNPKNTVFDIKRLIGRKFNDKEVQKDLKHFPFTLKSGTGDKPVVEVMYKNEVNTYHPEQVSAMVLGYMKETAESFLGHEVKKAVITVPAYFNDAQRQATKDAGTIAGLEVLRVINEPTAAAIAYGLDKRSDKETHVLVFDLGGGTFDVSILSLEGGVFEVRSTSGDTHLGGEDFDNRLVDFCMEEFKKKNKNLKMDIKEEKYAKTLRRLRTACERTKRALSVSMSSMIEVDSLFEGVDFNLEITRAKFEDLCKDLFEKCLDPVSIALRDAKMSKGQIDEIILVGGSTRIPKVQSLLKNYFNGKDLCFSVNPDEAIAFGASVQAAILTGQNKASKVLDGIVLLDITPLDLGVETRGEFMQVIVKRGTTVPHKSTETFTTYSHNQTSCAIKIYEGMRQFTKHNNLLGEFNLDGIPPMPQGKAQIEITYDIDANGILKVSAVEKSSGSSKNITITNDKDRLTKEQIQEMIDEAEKFKDEDEKNKQCIEARNDFEKYVYDWKSQLDGELAKKLDSEELEATKTKLKEYSDWVDDNKQETKETYEEKLKECESFMRPVIEKLYPDGAPQQGGVPPGMEGMDMNKMAEMFAKSGGKMPNMEGMDMNKMAEMFANMKQNGGDHEQEDDEKPSGPTIEEMD